MTIGSDVDDVLICVGGWLFDVVGGEVDSIASRARASRYNRSAVPDTKIKN